MYMYIICLCYLLVLVFGGLNYVYYLINLWLFKGNKILVWDKYIFKFIFEVIINIGEKCKVSKWKMV